MRRWCSSRWPSSASPATTRRWRRFETGVGAAATFYGVPDRLEPTHGDRPISFQVFFRLRPAPGAMGRMWNMRMTKPMHSPVADPHAGHQMP